MPVKKVIRKLRYLASTKYSFNRAHLRAKCDDLFAMCEALHRMRNYCLMRVEMCDGSSRQSFHWTEVCGSTNGILGNVGHKSDL